MNPDDTTKKPADDTTTVGNDPGAQKPTDTPDPQTPAVTPPGDTTDKPDTPEPAVVPPTETPKPEVPVVEPEVEGDKEEKSEDKPVV